MIGVVGHRPNAFRDVDLAQMRNRVGAVLEIACDTGRSVSLVSPLAEGADRLVAHETLAVDLPLISLLPFRRDVYAHDFATPDSLVEYENLLARSSAITELPGNAEERDAAYAALSDALIARIDLLIAIWDGEEPRGIGGTGQTVQAALERHIPVVWIDASPPHQARVLCQSSSGTTTAESLEHLPQRLNSSSTRRRS